MRSFGKVSFVAVTAAICALLAAHPAKSADLGPPPGQQLAEPAPLPSQWQFSFTPYGWLPWISGNLVVKGRPLNVAVDPTQIIDHLDWPTIVPVWMSYAEARRGPLSFFNDIVYTQLSGSGGFSGSVSGRRATATFGAHVSADYQLAIVEAGECLSNLVQWQPRFSWFHSFRPSCRCTLLAPRRRYLC